MSADVDSDLICSATATLATTHDAAVVGDLIDADPIPVAEIIADTHYGSGPTRQAMADRGIDLVAPAQPTPTRGGMFTKADFDIDLETATITCPQGNTAPIPPQRDAKRRQARFAATDCTQCDLKPRCTTRTGGRIVEINPYEELLAPARAQRWTPEFVSRYRLRAQAERKIAQIKSRTKTSLGAASTRPNCGSTCESPPSTSTGPAASASSGNTPAPAPPRTDNPTTTTGHTTAHTQQTTHTTPQLPTTLLGPPAANARQYDLRSRSQQVPGDVYSYTLKDQLTGSTVAEDW